LGFILSACNHASKPTASGSAERAESARGVDSWSDGRASIDGDAVVPPSSGARFRKEEGCARDFGSTGAALDDMAELERLCARGMTPLFAVPLQARASSTGVVDVPFSVDAPACLRVGAVAPVAGLSLSVFDPHGAPLLNASSSEPFGIVPVDGTVCVRDLGTYRTVVRLAGAAADGATVCVQIWQATRD
jgi:hypothetical protein